MGKNMAQVIELTSVNNQVVKDAAALSDKKFRDKSGLFLIEGRKCVEEAVKSGIELEKIFSLKEESIVSKEVYLVNEAVLKKISTTATAPDIVAIAKKKKFTIEQLNGKTIILLENIKDPGNVGTIIRTAVALGAAAIILSGDVVDIYNPKVVRSSVGSMFKIPIVQSDDFDKIRYQLRNHKFVGTILDESKSPTTLQEANFNIGTLIMFGSEADGLSEKAQQYVDEYIKIPMRNQVESLNIAISAGIIMYKAMV